MKAIRVQHTGGPEVMELAEVPIPQPKPNGAVVKVTAAGVNSIDVQFRDGMMKMPLPFIPGQEGAGVVTAVGPQTKIVKVGDRVAWSGTLGSYAEYVAAEAEHFPAYGFESNRGYPAPAHKCALAAYGPCAIHRRSWIFMENLPWSGIHRDERADTNGSLRLFTV